MNFEIVSDLTSVEVIARGHEIRDLALLEHLYSRGDWWKLKGIARIRLPSGKVRLAELHWYEARGIGRRELKHVRYVD